MRARWAILLTLGLLAIGVAADIAAESPVFHLIWVATTLWATYDAHRIGLKRYDLAGPVSPFTVFLSCLLLWSVMFPWFLVNKGKIARGEAPLLPEYAPPSTSTPAHVFPDKRMQLDALATRYEKDLISEGEFEARKAELSG
jgi:hypothetical protein